MHVNANFTICVNKSDSGRRIDEVVAFYVPDCSRSFAKDLIQKGKILVQGGAKKPGYRVKPGEEITGFIPPPEQYFCKPEPVPIDILYEDNNIIVLNKQAGIVVHPAPGHYSGTLLNGLLYHCPLIKGIKGELRHGIVHRLDKDTSGTLVVAKDAVSHRNLSFQFKSRTIYKKYLAIVHGRMEAESGTILFPVGRHPVDRKRMSTASTKSRSAETSWKVRETFNENTLLELELKTGRTHQIRVHCAAINHPVTGDSTYCTRGDYTKAGKKNLAPLVERQMLHSWQLKFTHPVTEKIVSFESPVPHDMEKIIHFLRNNAKC